MKKLTTNQMLIGGGVIALIYILYKRKKGQNGSDMIQDALNNSSNTPKADDGTPVSVSDGDKGTSEQDDPIIYTGGIKTKSCKQALAEFEKIKMTSRMTEQQLLKLRNDMLKGCTGAMPMPTKPYQPYPTKPTLPPIKPTLPPIKPYPTKATSPPIIPSRVKGGLIGIRI